METSAVEELATQLGIRSNELLTWLTGPGIESYITLQITRNALTSIVMLLIFIASARVVMHCLKKLSNTTTFDEDTAYTLGAVIGGIVAGTALFMFVSHLIFFIEWIIAPEGLIIETLIRLA